LTSENDVFGGHLTLPKYEIVDCGAFCEVIFFYISPKNLLGDFFYSLNGEQKGSKVEFEIRRVKGGKIESKMEWRNERGMWSEHGIGILFTC